MARYHDDNRCPLAAVDQRLDDLHRLWHQANDAYFDPDAFRVSIQSAIQTMRSVTFILQKNKATIPDFEGWYRQWQERLGADPLMVWMRDARNTIEKEGDLDAHSMVRAEIIASYLDNGPSIEVPANLWDAPLRLVKSIPPGAVSDHLRKEGIVRIQRRWVESTLPNYELLDAVAIAYGRLSLLVGDAHHQLGLPTHKAAHAAADNAYPEGERDGRLPCMIGHADSRALDVWLATGAPLEFEIVKPEVDLKEGPKLEARYGLKASEMYGASNAAEDRLRSLFAAARTMFEKDEYHVTIAFLLRDGKPVVIQEDCPGEHGHKNVMMRGLAHEVAKNGADAAIQISEAWSAPADISKPMMRAVESPNRSEVLIGTVVSKAAEPLDLVAQIKRGGKAVTLEPTVEVKGGAHFAFAPIYEAWGKPLPADWMSAVATDETQRE
jgi:hypothetical protein